MTFPISKVDCLDRLDRSSTRAVFFVVFLPLCAVFFSTANRSLPYHIDTGTNVITAWSIGARGTVYMDSSELSSAPSFGNVGLFRDTPRGRTVSQYPPGAALLAAPLYALFDEVRQAEIIGSNRPDTPAVSVLLPSFGPASLIAAGSTAAAMAVLAVSVVGMIGNRAAIVAGLLGGIGTGAWSVASNELWQHGPAMLWLALGLLQLSRERHFTAGLALALAIVTRPPTAVIAAIAGIWSTFSSRSFRPAISVGTGSSLGLAALVVYNSMVFGGLTVSGGYGQAFNERLANSGLVWFFRNITGALFDPVRGLLIWAPFLIVLIPGIPRAWRAAPPWVRGAAVGGALLLLIQLKVNRFSGGEGFFAYRYPLEALVVAAPLLVLSYREWVAKSPTRVRLFLGTATLAVVAQSVGAIAL